VPLVPFELHAGFFMAIFMAGGEIILEEPEEITGGTVFLPFNPTACWKLLSACILPVSAASHVSTRTRGDPGSVSSDRSVPYTFPPC